MAELSIRRYHPDDHERVIELHVDPMEEVDAFVEDEALDADMQDIKAAYIQAGGAFLVGEVDGRIVAIGAYKPPSDYVHNFLDDLPPDTAEITRMRVASEYQRRGFGQQIYEALERRAHEAGIEYLVLDTTKRQTAARGLYEQMGFQELTRRAVTLDGNQLTMIFFGKAL